MSTPAPVEFWFDFISPYAYFASRRIDDLAARHGRAVRWRPMLLGVAVMQAMGLRPLMETPLKAPYVVRDLQRSARRHAIPLGRDLYAPPMNPLPAGRAMAWLDVHRRARASLFARLVFDRYWGQGLALDSPVELHRALADAGVSPADAASALARDPAAALLKTSVDESLAQGVFGAPFVVVDGEPFWGHDRLDEVEAWLGQRW